VDVSLCRLALHVETSNASGMVLEAWLPQNWTGRFLSTGNGGLSGCVQYFDLAYTAALGFASVGTNNGHNGTSGKAFLNASGVIEDFAYRAAHTGVVLGKQITQIFYEQNYTNSYFLGCSNGGRQGMRSAQMGSWPELRPSTLSILPAGVSGCKSLQGSTMLPLPLFPKDCGVSSIQKS
jgi:feruloyl esterase